MNLEDQLRQALRRQDPPEGFADRVLQQAGQARVHFVVPTRRKRLGYWWQAASIAAGVALVFSASVQYRHVQEERAGRQAVEALRLAAEGLNWAQSEVLNK